MADLPADVRGPMHQMMAGLTSEQALTASMADTWATVVAYWLGAELEFGAVYDARRSNSRFRRFQAPRSR